MNHMENLSARSVSFDKVLIAWDLQLTCYQLHRNPTMYTMDGGDKWSPVCDAPRLEDGNTIGGHIIK